MLGCGHGLEGREPWRSGVASSDVTLTLDLVARVVYIILLLDDYVQKRNPAPRARFRFQIWALFGPNPLGYLGRPISPFSRHAISDPPRHAL